MDKPSAVHFKVKAKQQLALGMLCGLGFIALILFQLVLRIDGWASVLSGLVTVAGGVLFIYAIRSPVIRFVDEGFYFKPSLISGRAYYAFDEIEHILPSETNNTVHFQLENGQTVHLHLNHLGHKDHIRFIFLLESDVNRKHVLKSIASHKS